MKTQIFVKSALLALVFHSAAWAQLPTPAPLAPGKVACVGDSITAGSGAGPNDSYPKQLQGLLGAGWAVENFGVGGTTLLRKGDRPYWNTSAFTAAQAFAPDAVIIMLGTNDTKTKNQGHRNEFRSDYRALVKVFQNLPSKPKIYLCRPCPVPEANQYDIKEAPLRAEIAAIDQIAHDENLPIIDMHAALASHPELQPDHVHPNAAGYALIAAAAYQALTGKPAPAPAPVANQSVTTFSGTVVTAVAATVNSSH